MADYILTKRLMNSPMAAAGLLSTFKETEPRFDGTMKVPMERRSDAGAIPPGDETISSASPGAMSNFEEAHADYDTTLVIL